MKKIILIFVLLIIFISCKNNGLIYENSFIIENVNLIDPIQGLKKNMSIIINGNKIIEIYKTDSIKLSSKNKIYRFAGKYLIPGLWDSHVHFSYERDLSKAMPNLFLAHGITSVRDTGGEFDFVNKFKQDAIQDPKTKTRVMIAGPLIDGKFNVYDGSSKALPLLSIKNNNLEQLEKNALHLIESQVDFLKAYEMLSPEQFKLLAEIAKKNNLKLTGHVPLSMNVIEASNMGLSSIEHLRNIELSMTNESDKLFQERQDILKNKLNIKGSALRSMLHKKQRMRSIYDLDSSKIKSVVEVLVKNDTWQIPTMRLVSNKAYKIYKDPEYTPLLEVLPLDKKKEWIQKINLISSAPDKEIIDYAKWSSNMVNFMQKRGISFMAGTDTPIGFLIPGLSLHQELEDLHNSGLSTLETIQTATINPAKYFNIQDSLGRIKSGFIADLLVLDNNPLEDISNTKSILAVIKDGYYMNRAHLDSLLSLNK